MTVMKRIYRFFLLAICFICCNVNAKAVEEASPDALFYSKQYAKALEAYTQLEKKGMADANLYCNIANSAYHLDDYALAVLNYRKALALDPYNANAINNLDYLRQKIEDRNQADMKNKKGSMAAEEPSFFQQVYNFIAIDNSCNLWAWLAASAFILFTVSVLLYVLPQSILLKKIGFFGGGAWLILCIILLVFSFMASSPDRFGKIAVIKEASVVLRSQYQDDAESTTTPLSKGSELQILQTKKDVNGESWALVRLNSDNQGWIKESNYYLFK